MSMTIDPNLVLLESDGEPLESLWHVLQIPLLIEIADVIMEGRDDFFAGGNMFIYYSEAQARNLDYRGPDFFFVKGVSRTPLRKYWVLWEENWKFPDVIIELTSPTTAKVDRTTKKNLYETVFKTSEYFLFDPDGMKMTGWRLDPSGQYQAIPEENGRLWCEQMECYFGTWRGPFRGTETSWFRAFSQDGKIILLGDEAEHARAERASQRAKSERARAESERARAESEKARADAAEAELARLKAELAKLQQGTSRSNP